MADATARPSATPALCLRDIALANFRSYSNTKLKLEPAPIVLAGPNGTGKTNCLEAVSLLSPGKGLRGAKLAQLQRRVPLATAHEGGGPLSQSPWAVSATIARPEGEWDIGTGLTTTTNGAQRRALYLNGVPAHAADLAELLPVLWLTPSMDRLFLEGASERRRFLDRLVFGLDTAHARRASRYERAMSERLRLLRDGIRDAAWLDGLETTMAEEGDAVSAARRSAIEKLNGELSTRGSQGAFPCAHLTLNDDSAGEGGPAELQAALVASRSRDAETGRTGFGPHLADLDVRHTQKRTDARDCSTGEQKALLISIVLANAWLQKKRGGGVAPVLLLDEIAAHLDAARRDALFEEILALQSQAWLTGTDRSLFTPLRPHARFLAVIGGAITRQD